MTEATAVEQVTDLQSQVEALQAFQQLAAGRNEVLRMVAQGGSLQSTLTTLIEKSQTYNNKMICSVLRYNPEHNTLHPCGETLLPDFYTQAIDGLVIGPNVGSCGTAVFSKKRVIVENIASNPYWEQYKDLALKANLRACWSEPIIGREGEVLGSFSTYYQQPCQPRADDLNFLELSANLCAVIIESDNTRQALLDANEQLNQSIDQRTTQLQQSNQELRKMMEQQRESQIAQIKAEKILTTNSLLTGFAHEVNTPIGIAMTAISTAKYHLSMLMDDFSSGKLTRKIMANKVSLVTDSIELNKRNLIRTSKLMATFKAMDYKLDKNDCESFQLAELFHELPGTLVSLLKDYRLKIDCTPLKVPHSKHAFWQVMSHLIENSVIHGFHGRKTGLIYISAAQHSGQLIINYQDNGCGIKEEMQQQIFEPFYSTKRTRGSIGLGLNIVINIITNTFGGSIRCLKAPSGIRFEIIMPL
ncbi:MAG: signal transduction histidine kinase [Phenylobacterium sp.]|jgi:signal transduction histidine kinase